MKILYVIERFPTYSQTFIYDEICNHLDHGEDVHIVVLGNSGTSDFQVDEYGADIKRRTTYLDLVVSGSRLAKARLIITGLWTAYRAASLSEHLRLWRRSGLTAREVLSGALIASKCPDFDIIHCHFGNIGRVGLAAREQMRRKPRLFVTFHAYEMLKSWSQPLENFYASLFASDAILLPISEFWRSKLVSAGANSARTWVHHMSVDIPPEESLESSSPDTDISKIVMVGRMVEKKGHLSAIEALSLLRESRPDIEFQCDLIGNGPLFNEVATRINDKGLSSHVRLFGSKSHTETLECIASADIFLLPSVTARDGDMEGIPVVLMEAMARRIPVLSTYHSGIPELVEDQSTGLLVPEHDTDKLAEAILLLVTDSDLRRKLGAAGRNKVIEEFNRTTLSKTLQEYYYLDL
ncbi:MAG: glycosyltransferase [Novosphingobium sp.]|nr:glycosyltransferase [Novosphingobium sp.]